MILEGCTIVQEIGRGARNLVYRARMRERWVALKRPRVSRPGDLDGYRREASLQARIGRAWVPEVYEVGEVQQDAYLISELIDGQPLHRLLSQGRLSPQETQILGVTLCQTLAAIHRLGLVHRDIKPANIMVVQEGGYRLIDFGLATSLAQAGQAARAGTFLYSAPEQTGLLHRSLDGRADLYALGVVLYECLLGQPPLVHDNPAELLRLHAVQTPIPVSQLRPEVPPHLCHCLQRLLAKDPDDRFADAEEVAEALGVSPSSRSKRAVHSSSPLQGRSQELQMLQQQWLEAQSGRGRLLRIGGESGLGKSHLLRTFAQRQSLPVLEATCQPAQAPFETVEQLLRQVWSHRSQMSLMSPERQQAQAAVASAADWLPQLFPTFQELDQTPPPKTPAHELRGDWASPPKTPALGVNPVAGLARLLSRLLELGPHLVVLHNFEHLDLASARVLEALKTDLEGLPVLILAECHEPPWDVELSALSGLETGQLLKQMLGSDCEPDLAKHLASLSQGNPLVLQECLNAALDAGACLPHWGRWRAHWPSLAGLQLGGGLQALLQRRLDRLSPSGLRLLRRAALLGASVAVDQLRGISPRDLSELVEAGFLESHANLGLIQEGIRQALLAPLEPEQRRLLHLENAQALGSDQVYALAEQAFLAQPEASFDLDGLTLRAAQLALRQHAYSQSYRYFQRLSLARQATVLPEFAEAAYRMGHLEQAQDLLRQALEASRAPEERARLGLLLAEYQLIGLQTRKVAQVLEGVARELRLQPCLTLAARLHLLSCQVALFEGDLWALLLGLFQGLRVSSSLASDPTQAILLHYASALLAASGLPGAARSLGRRACSLYQGLENSPEVWKCRVYQILAERLLDEAQASRMAAQLLKDQGHCLPTFEYVALAVDLTHNFHFRGLVGQAFHWAELGARRVQDECFPAVLTCTFSALYSAVGRHAEAQQQHHLCSLALESSGSLTSRCAYLVSGIHSALEAEHWGTQLESWLREFHSLGLTPLTCPYHVRVFYLLEGYIRLRQGRPVELGRALRRLALTSHLPLFKTHQAVLWAGYYRLQAQPQRCRRWLVRAEALAQEYDNAWVRLEAMRQRALLWRGEQRLEAYRREADVALAQAVRLGWTSMQASLEREFDLDSSASSLSSLGNSSWQSNHSHQNALQLRLQRNLDTLLEVTASSGLLDPSRMMRTAVEKSLQLVCAQRTLLFLYRGQELTLQHSSSLLVNQVEHAQEWVEQVAQSGRTLNRDGGQRYPQLRSVLVTPLKLQERVLGVLYLDTQLARGAFSQDDVQLILGLASQVAAALEMSRVGRLEAQVQAEREQRQLAEHLGQAIGALMGHSQADSIGQQLLDGIPALVPCQAAAFRGSQGESWQRNQPQANWSSLELDLNSRLGQSERLSLWRDTPFRPIESELLRSLGSYAVLALDNARLVQRLEHLATTDELTGILNRRHFFRVAEEELRRADRLKHPLCVVMFDIDHFKKVNDNYGHPTGDAVIKMTARHCSGNLRTIDLLGRYGGEEFAAILVGTDRAGGRLTAERLRQGLQQQVVQGPSQQELSISASFGLVERQPGEGLEAALARADQALYLAKQKGRNRVEDL